jgi:hypothetical protein
VSGSTGVQRESRPRALFRRQPEPSQVVWSIRLREDGWGQFLSARLANYTMCVAPVQQALERRLRWTMLGSIGMRGAVAASPSSDTLP